MITVGFSTTKRGVAGFLSWIIRKFTRSRFSHTWIRYYHEHYRMYVVIEASIYGIIEVPYERYMQTVTDVVELVPVDVHLFQGMPAIGNMLATDYDLRSLFGRMIKITAKWLGHKIKNPLSDSAKDCCVDNVIRCLKSSGEKYATLEPDEETPESLYQRLVLDGWKRL